MKRLTLAALTMILAAAAVGVAMHPNNPLPLPGKTMDAPIPPCFPQCPDPLKR